MGFVSLFIGWISEAFYLPGSYPHKYLKGDELWVKVNSLTSVETEFPYRYYSLLCVMVGNGVQILGMGVVTILFAAFAGYAAVRLWRTINSGDHKGWLSVSWRVACFFPGIAFLILTTLNFLLWSSHNTGAIPFSLFVVLILLWFCISVPLTLVGGYFGVRAAPIEYPVRTNQIPPKKYPSWLLVLGAGTLPFGTLFIELFFILSSLWLGHVYDVFGFLLIIFVLFVVVCAEVSPVLTYIHLCVEDWQWWWKAFFSCGSVAIYIFLYSVNYLVLSSTVLSGPFQQPYIWVTPFS
ncbi:hypothetical protein AMTR_s00027p00189910 [Amborella trichopoda]|uniref:Transmembrane 9 superfamily member n=1 Tax=Amborella trichopoda TaxID=13333 RepID=W1PL87_AMBTC|nr:hypothetical protein AMTR_s00027p00189910 [Amborella trichopoda]